MNRRSPRSTRARSRPSWRAQARLSGELKGAGDKDGSAKLAKLARPPISAWVVNQLYWRERDSFDELLESAAQLRKEISARPRPTARRWPRCAARPRHCSPRAVTARAGSRRFAK